MLDTLKFEELELTLLLTVRFSDTKIFPFILNPDNSNCLISITLITAESAVKFETNSESILEFLAVKEENLAFNALRLYISEFIDKRLNAVRFAIAASKAVSSTVFEFIKNKLSAVRFTILALNELKL